MPLLDLITEGSTSSMTGKSPLGGLRYKHNYSQFDNLKKCDSTSSSIASDGGDSEKELPSPGSESTTSSGYESNLSSPVSQCSVDAPTPNSTAVSPSPQEDHHVDDQRHKNLKSESNLERSNSSSAIKILKANSEVVSAMPPGAYAQRAPVIARFSSAINSSVITRRNFGFCFGNDITSSNGPVNLLMHVDRKAEAELRSKPPVKPPFAKRMTEPVMNVEATESILQADGDPPALPESVHQRKSSAPPKMFEFGEGGLGDRSSNRWMWPGVRQPHVVQDEGNFQVEIDIRPFNDKEVWGKVIGHELTMTCLKSKATDEHHFGPDRWFCRSYQLPMNIDPRTVKFRLIKGYKLIIAGVKIPQLKMMVACYIDQLLAKGEEVTDKKIADKIYGTDNPLLDQASVAREEWGGGCPPVPEQTEDAAPSEQEKASSEDCSAATTDSSVSTAEPLRVGSSVGLSTPLYASSDVSSEEPSHDLQGDLA